jgi:hypothetical protein
MIASSTPSLPTIVAFNNYLPHLAICFGDFLGKLQRKPGDKP